jgi:hypothetical protein
MLDRAVAEVVKLLHISTHKLLQTSCVRTSNLKTKFLEPLVSCVDVHALLLDVMQI